MRALEARLAPTGAHVVAHETTAHEVGPLVGGLERAAKAADLVIVFGASAITDRRDVIPAAIEAFGGRIERFGMPVDPGNLLLLAAREGLPIIGAPGCARSPKENGFDWVLQRLIAGTPISGADIRAMGVGGLLMEIASRPQPREPHELGSPPSCSRPGGLPVFAPPAARRKRSWWRSSRAGRSIRRAVEAALGSRARPVIVVVGHARSAVEVALAGLPATFAFNPEFETGIASSLRTGLAATPDEADGAVVLLGDMPNVVPSLIDELIDAFEARPALRAVAPYRDGRRGNPVLLARSLFDQAMRLAGDEGARGLLAALDPAPSPRSPPLPMCHSTSIPRTILSQCVEGRKASTC